MAISAAGLASYFITLTVLLMAVECRARRITCNNGAAIPPLTLRALGKMLTTIPLAHGLYVAAALKAQFARSLTWRGVRYTINGKLDVDRVEPVRLASPPARADNVFIGQRTGTGDLPRAHE